LFIFGRPGIGNPSVAQVAKLTTLVAGDPNNWEEKEMEIQKKEDQYPSRESIQHTLSEFMS
jgi:hypothetical protein